MKKYRNRNSNSDNRYNALTVCHRRPYHCIIKLHILQNEIFQRKIGGTRNNVGERALWRPRLENGVMASNGLVHLPSIILPRPAVKDKMEQQIGMYVLIALKDTAQFVYIFHLIRCSFRKIGFFGRPLVSDQFFKCMFNPIITRYCPS